MLHIEHFILSLHGSAEEAETKAIMYALRFCQQFCFSNLIIECDSSTVVGWVNNSVSRPANLLNVLNQIDFLSTEVNYIEIRHIFRESNVYADSLAKEACMRKENMW